MSKSFLLGRTQHGSICKIRESRSYERNFLGVKFDCELSYSIFAYIKSDMQCKWLTLTGGQLCRQAEVLKVVEIPMDVLHFQKLSVLVDLILQQTLAYELMTVFGKTQEKNSLFRSMGNAVYRMKMCWHAAYNRQSRTDLDCSTWTQICQKVSLHAL